MSSLQPCSNTSLLDQYLDDQDKLASNDIEINIERSEKTARYIDDQMCNAAESDAVIEIICNDDFVISALDDLCIIDCDKDFNKLTFDEVRRLAQAAYTYNNRICHALASPDYSEQ